MNRRRRNRLYLCSLLLAGAALTVTLALYALGGNIDLFYTPREILYGKGRQHELPHVGQRLRVGGWVMPGSVKRDPATLDVSFKLYDAAGAISVSYHGVLPDLFREGQGAVAQGILTAGDRVRARQVLAKHDENYLPPEVADDKRGNASSSGGQSRPEALSANPALPLRGAEAMTLPPKARSYAISSGQRAAEQGAQ
ncbi:cytochrome c maturation protein CcmE [Martelella alba]|uniref:Cytochrome c-type biogenesis protein CcmE n=1 Tax=Martelella alba TaxID=2590451 RepID=A0ABY2SKL1_9HYPH|nr:cytochrome c maturation protein CcmE [Martelella alba]TKI03864.1 cytochrome c maturation protein CcmE [Martelella alba]